MAVTNKTLRLPILMNGLPFHDLWLNKFVVDSTVMSLGDKITGDVYYPDNSLVEEAESKRLYVTYDGIDYVVVNPPTIVREGLVKDNSDLRGMTKYTFEFYHPMYMLNNLPFSDVAVSSDETRYKSEDKTFSWMGYLGDFVAKLNKNLEHTKWVTVIDGVKIDKLTTLSEVLSFNNNTIGDALKTCYDTWEVPFVIDKLQSGEYLDANNNDYYTLGKRFVIIIGLPSNEIYANESDKTNDIPFIFNFGQGLGLLNNSRTPRNNKIITRLAGYGSEDNIPYGYPQIRWYGDQSWTNTKNDPTDPTAYPIYEGIYGGQYVKLIQHPFTRHHLMPPVYVESLFNKISPYLERVLPSGTIVANPDYDPDTTLVDYYDADDPSHYPNVIDLDNPSYEIHEFEKIKPQLIDKELSAVEPYEEQTYISPTDFNEYLDYCIRKARFRSTSTIVHHFEWLKLTWSSGSSDVSDYRSDNEFYYGKVRNDSYFSYVSVSSDVESFEKKILTAANPPSDWDDSMNDNGELNQSYFKLTLPVLDFDLYACAAITQEMTINMRSGACIGCQFQVQVDWDDYKANFYLNDGTFDPNPHTTSDDGHVRDITKYPDSSQTALTLIVAKDTSTFGIVMPNVYQQPARGDKFNILGISLPISYITNAQQRLEDDMKQFLLENNVYYYDYPLKPSEHFLYSNTYILAQIRNNTIFRFRYWGDILALYVKQITIKYGNSPLPQFAIELTDDVEIVLNQIGQVTDDVTRLRLQVTELQQYYDKSLINEVATKLSRTVDDVANGKITFAKGVQSDGNVTVGDFVNNTSGTRITPTAEVETGSIILRNSITSPSFVADPLLGYGFAIYNEQDGQSVISKAEFDYLTIRRGMKVAVLEIAEYKSVNGGLVLSPANGVIESVETSSDSPIYVIKLKESNQFVAHDLIMCRKWDSYNDQTSPLKTYWVEVQSSSGLYIDVNKSDFTVAGVTVAPTADDVLVLMGNTTITDRQGFAIITDAGMSVYDGVNSTSNVALLSKLKAKFGDLSGITWWNGTSNVNLSGYGLYGDNVYLKGSFTLLSNRTVEQTISDGDATVTTNVTTAFQAADDGIRSSVSKVTNTLQDGGVNLARQTNLGVDGWSYYAKKSDNTVVSSNVTISAIGEGVAFSMWDSSFALGQQYFQFGAPFAKTIESGKKYTVSAEVFINSAEGNKDFSTRLLVGATTAYPRTGTSSNTQTISGTSGWQQVSFLIETDYSSQSTDKSLFVRFNNLGQNSLEYFAIRNLKIEEGEIATTYTKAPEDTSDEFTEVRSEITQTAERISMEVVGMLLNNDQDTLYTNATPEFTLNSSTRLWGRADKFAISKYLSTGYYTIVMSIEIGSAWTGFSLAIESYSYISFSFTNEERNKGATVTQAIKRTFFLEELASPTFQRVYVRMDGANVGDTNAEAVLHGVWLYEGDGVVGSLARTGIDIETGVITLQADTVKVKDTNGNVNGVFNASDGTLQTNRIRVAELDASLIDTNHLVARDSNGMVKATVNADFVNGTLTQTNDGAYRIYYPSTQVNSEWVQNTAKKLELLDVNRGDANDPYWTTLRMFDTDGQTIAWELGTDAMTNGFTNPNFTLVNIAKNVNTDTDAKVAVNFDSQVCKWNETSGTLVAVSDSPISTSNAYYEAEYTASKTMWDETTQQYITLTGQTLYSRRKWTYNSSTTKWEIDTITWLVTDDTPDQNARTL